MKINNIEKGKKAHFDNIEDILQTFFAIARTLYQVGSTEGDLSDKGVLCATAKVENKTIRIRIDFPEGDDIE